MSQAIGKLAPTAIVAAVVAWCCWPYLREPTSGAGVEEDGNLPQIARSLLSPAIKPASSRDPFQPLDTKKTVSTRSQQPTAPGTTQEVPTPKEDTTDILNSLALDATYIQGNRRVALINGRVCVQGEPLAISDSAPLSQVAEPWIVTQISAHKVLIQRRGRTVELRYRDPVLKVKPGKADEQRYEEHREPQ